MTDERLPVLVGVGVATQRGGDAEAIELMARAAEDAITDCGVPVARDRIGWIGVPEGTWHYRDAGRLLAQRLAQRLAVADAEHCATVMADVGILQQDLFVAAADAVTTGGAAFVLVAGGEAKDRETTAKRAGLVASEQTQADDVEPDIRIRPDSLGVTDLEIVRNIVSPVAAYAVIENAIGHHRDRTLDEHRDVVAELQARFFAVAAGNPAAWDRTPRSAAEIRDAGPGNRMISFPYTKRHSSQWNVDQASALLFCSLATARSVGIADDRLIFPRASAVANHAVPLSERRDLHRSIGAELVGRAIRAHVPADIELAAVDLYSCFPSAVQLLAGGLGLQIERGAAPTVTGGMAAAGGPLNNYVLQAVAALVGLLRANPGSWGVTSSVSGYLMKQGMSLWSTEPPGGAGAAGRGGPPVEDATERARRETETVAVVAKEGVGSIASWTVDFATDGADSRPARAVALIDFADGLRTIGVSHDVAVATQLVSVDPIGTRVVVGGDGSFHFTD